MPVITHLGKIGPREEVINLISDDMQTIVKSELLFSVFN